MWSTAEPPALPPVKAMDADNPADLARRRQGIWLVLGAALAWSTAGFFTRVVEADLWTMLVWRGGLGAVVLFLFLRLRDGRQWLGWWRAGGIPLWVAAWLAALAMVAFIAALSETTVAKVSLIYAAVPFAAAMLAYLLIGETPGRAALVASAVAALGIVIMVGPALAVGGGAWTGDALALLMTLLMALLTVHMRRYPDLPMTAVAAISCLMSALIALPFADPLSVRPGDIPWLMLFGPITTGIGFVLYAQGAQRLLAAEAALLGALETPLGPLWVWLLFAEMPDQATLLGGGLIFVTLMIYIWRDHKMSVV
ncbi:DMT family transporter [Dongia sp.]|uniref:DMT family transporter n=1 Tax=Dongia sp. TaxID=1977262 RepID=UPI0035B47AB9